MFRSFMRCIRALHMNIKFYISLAQPHPALEDFSGNCSRANGVSAQSMLKSTIHCNSAPTISNDSDKTELNPSCPPCNSLEASKATWRPSKTLRRVKHKSIQSHSIRTTSSDGSLTPHPSPSAASTPAPSRDTLTARQTLLFEGSHIPCVSRWQDMNETRDFLPSQASSTLSYQCNQRSDQTVSPPKIDDVFCSKPSTPLQIPSNFTDSENHPGFPRSSNSLDAHHSLRPNYIIDVKPSLAAGLFVPSVVLTCPTPNVPSSPVFVPRTPITVSRFVSASSVLMSPFASTSSAAPVPSLPECEACGLAAFETGDQCPDCDHQWLACKIWYHANEGGTKQHLTEPYIKPGESNARNRAMLDFLGVPNGHPETVGLGFQVTPHEQLPTGRWRRLIHSLPGGDKAVTEATPTLTTKEHNNDIHLTRGFLARPFVTTISAFKYAWKISKDQILSRVRLDDEDLVLLITGPYAFHRHPVTSYL